MKFIYLTMLTFGLVSCSNSPDKETTGNEKTKDRLVHIDTFYIDQGEVNSNEYKEFYQCEFDKFLNDPQTPKLAKDIYLDKEWNLGNDTEALALLDSLTAKDKTSRPFYFKVVTKTYQKSDGYFSEGLGLIGKEYVENNTKEFISNFENKDCFTDNDLTTWADIVMLELGLYGEELKTKNIVQDYARKIKYNCKELTQENKEMINKFCNYLFEKQQAIVEEIELNKKAEQPNR